MQIWMAKDPLTNRITAQDREFGDGDLPAGNRGTGWTFRHHPAVEDDLWQDLLAGRMSPEQQDSFHHLLWAQAPLYGDPQ